MGALQTASRVDFSMTEGNMHFARLAISTHSAHEETPVISGVGAANGWHYSVHVACAVLMRICVRASKWECCRIRKDGGAMARVQ